MAEIDAIEEDESDAEQFPSVRPGELDIDQWLVNRIAGSAHLAGGFVDITSAETVAAFTHSLKARRWRTTSRTSTRQP